MIMRYSGLYNLNNRADACHGAGYRISLLGLQL